MTAQEATAFALRLPKAVEDYPFGDSPAVYKVEGRIFAFVVSDPDRPRLSLKCEPRLAEALRAQYASVIPGWHLNKRHWNTIELDGTVPDEEIEAMVVHSYECVVAKLPKATRVPLVEAIGERGFRRL